MTSTWELDDRPGQPCVLCRGIPDRIVDLPQLPDVHIAFASSSMCETCAGLATANAVEELTRRGETGWADDPDAVASLVRLVVAAFGHRPPPAEVAPETLRHRSMEPLSDADTMLWHKLEPLIYDGPPGQTVRVRGTIEYSVSDETERRLTVALRDGPKARLASSDGRPWLLCDGETLWRRDGEQMYARSYAGADEWSGEGSDLAARRTRHDVELFSFGTPIGPIEATTYLGRPAWQFRFAAPPHKPFDMAVIVDDETGLMLEQRFGTYSEARWTAFETDVDIPAEMFVWTGPLVDLEQRNRAERIEIERQGRERATWFAANVTAQPLTVRGELVQVNLHASEDDGTFEASLDGGIDGALARRPRSEQWWNLEWSDVTHRWSDKQWDWALSEFDDEAPRLSSDQLDAVKQALGPN